MANTDKKLKTLIHIWGKAQDGGIILPCPRCGKHNMSDESTYALSRRENVCVCEQCGMEEALEDVTYDTQENRKLLSHEWWIAKEVYENDVELSTEEATALIDYVVKAPSDWYDTIEEDFSFTANNSKEANGIVFDCVKLKNSKYCVYSAKAGKVYAFTIDSLKCGFKIAYVYGYLEDCYKDGQLTSDWLEKAADTILQCAIFGGKLAAVNASSKN